MPTTAEFRQRLAATSCEPDIADVILDMFDEANARKGAAAEQLGARLDRHEAENEDRFRSSLDQANDKIAELHEELVELRIENERRSSRIEQSISKLREENERRFGEAQARTERRFSELVGMIAAIDRRMLVFGLSLAALIVSAAAAASAVAVIFAGGS